jgi:ribonuclease E
MPNKMLIDATHPEETRVVVVRGNRVEEFDFETAQRKQLRGNIYLAKVTRVEPSLQAAFIEYGGNRHGFLAFSEIHPDYYQIPVADRQALIEADERAHREAEEETENRSSRGRRPRHRNQRRRGSGERVQSDIVESAGLDPSQAPQPHVEDGGEQGETGHHQFDAAPEQQHLHAGDHDRPSSDDAPAMVAEQASADVSQTASPEPSSDAQGVQTLHPDDATAPPAESAAAAKPEEDHAHHDHANHDHEHAHPHGDDEHNELIAAHHEDSEHAAHAEAPVDDTDSAGDSDDDDEGEETEEEMVESVGGDDVMEEVPERAFRPRRQYKIQEVIKRRQVMLVQVVKEERGNKGAALTTYLSLAGRYAVLMPNTARGGGISRKITSAQDRSRLKDVVSDLDVPEGMGIILRTAGASRTKPEIKRDFEYLIRMWETVRDMTLKSQAPTLVYEEGSLIKRSLRDLYNKEIDEIQVAGDAGYSEARDFMKMLMPSNVRTVRQYRDGQPLFSRMGVESQLDAMFSPTVQLRSGGYIVINQTEALVSIDVNSGRSTREHHIEDTALKTNMEASEEVARQLRLRDLAGLIVIDFIDMDEKRNNRSVERKLSDCLRQDRARIQVGRISHFGLLEMSRQRIRASVLESSTEPCPQCGGSGHVRSVSSVALQLVRGLEEILMKGATHNLTVRTRADVALYVLNHKRAHLRDLEHSFKVTLTVIADPTVTAHQSFIIDRGEQVHTLEAAKAVLAAQVAAFPVHVEEDAEGDEPFDDEVEVETEETEGLVSDANAGDAGETETEGDGSKRKRRRRRRGRPGEAREGGPRDDNEVMRTAADAAPALVADDDSENENGVDHQPGAEAVDSNGERRPRRRGRRGGRRRRGGPEDAQSGSFADNGAPPSAPEFNAAPSESEGYPPQPERDTPRAEPVAQQPEPQKAERDRQEAPTAPVQDDIAREAERAARRRSTVREKVSFMAGAQTAPASDSPPPTAPAPAEPAPQAASENPPRKAGWWSRAFGNGE